MDLAHHNSKCICVKLLGHGLWINTDRFDKDSTPNKTLALEMADGALEENKISKKLNGEKGKKDGELEATQEVDRMFDQELISY